MGNLSIDAFLVHNTLITLINTIIHGKNRNQCIKDLKELFNDPIRLGYLLRYYGISEELLSSPAHRQNLEEIAQICLKTLIDNDFNIIDFNVIPDKKIVIELGSPNFLAAKLNIEILDNSSYKFTTFSQLPSRITHSTDIEIAGNKNKILHLKTTNTIHSSGDIFSQKVDIVTKTDQAGMVLDNNGFAQQYIVKMPNGTKSKLTLKDGMINGTIPWNGNPLHLNFEECTDEDLYKNISSTIKRNPSASQYYIDTFGEDRVTSLLEQFKQFETD